jgi:hypothetical protein
MPNNKNSRSSERKGRSKQSKHNDPRTDNLERQLIALNKQQQMYALPSTPDINFPRIKQNTIHNFVLSFVAGTITSNVAGVTTSFNLSLNSFPTSTQFTGLFDTYRIMTAKAIFNPVATLPSNGDQPAFQTAIDYDDSSTSTNLLDRDTSMTVMAGQYFERNWTPHVASALYSGTFTSYGNLSHVWIDAGSPSVLHYGLKTYQPPATAALPIFEVTIRCHVQFKNNF